MARELTFKKTLWGIGWTMAQPLMLNALSLPAMAYIIRRLGPTAYGEWSVATALIGTLAFLANFGLRGQFVRAVARDPEGAPGRFAEQLGVRSLLSVMTAGIAVGVCVALGYSRVIVECTAIAGVGLVLGVLASVAVDYLEATHRLTTVAVVSLIAGLLLTGASVVTVWRGGGPVAVSWSYLVGPAVSATGLLGLVGWREFPVRVRWNVGRFMALFVESRYFIAQQAINIVSVYAAALLLPKLIGTTEFGYYTAGTLLVTRLSVIPDALAAAFYPIVAKAHMRGVAPASRKAAHYLGLSLLGSVPAACVVYMLAGPVAHILFPGREEQCRRIMQLTIWMLPIMSTAYAMGYSLNAAGYEAESTRRSMVSAAVQIVLTVVLIGCWGMTGACWMLVLRYVVSIVVLGPLFFRVFPGLMGHWGRRDGSMGGGEAGGEDAGRPGRLDVAPAIAEAASP